MITITRTVTSGSRSITHTVTAPSYLLAAEAMRELCRAEEPQEKPVAEVTPPPAEPAKPPRIAANAKRYICDDFPGQVFLAGDVRRICGLGHQVPLHRYITMGHRMGGKHSFREEGTEPVAPKPAARQMGRPGRPIVSEEFPGRTFTLKEVSELTGVKQPHKAVRRQSLLRGKYRFRYADAPVIATAVAKPAAKPAVKTPVAAAVVAAEPVTVAKVTAQQKWGDAENAKLRERAKAHRKGKAAVSDITDRSAGFIPTYVELRGRTRGQAAGEDLMPVNGQRILPRADTPTFVSR